MSTSDSLEEIRGRLAAGYSVLLLETHEEDRWEDEIAGLADEIDRGLVTWSATVGSQPAISEQPLPENPADALFQFLEIVSTFPSDHLFYIKDAHPCLTEPRIIRKLRDLTGALYTEQKGLLFVSPRFALPEELEKDAVQIRLPLPGLEELRDQWDAVQANREPPMFISADDEERMLQGALGLTTREAHRAFSKASAGKSAANDDLFAELVSEKRHLIQAGGRDLLEFRDLESGVTDVGGLFNLKEWLKQRSTAFSLEARDQGIPLPKGVLLLGVQGCGKSLTARVTASLLRFPLVRMDASNLLSGERGQSEQNMRTVLSLLEAVSPVVCWIDEIEKGFAGLEGDADGRPDATMARLFGQFLTWMEERRSPIFVVATANSVEQLPPELLRRGRFDELFFIDLPNYEERKEIFRIHIEKRGWNIEKFDTGELATQTESYSGAEIEQIVSSAMLDAYAEGRMLTDEDILAAKEEIVPLATTMEEKVFRLREWAKGRARPATPDSRVVQLLEEEERHGISEEGLREEPDFEWLTLAEYGQSRAALVAYVGGKDRVTFPQLQEAFADFIDVTGGQGLALRANPNVVLWSGLGGELAFLLAKLLNARRLYLHPAEVQHYDDTPGLPALKEIPDEKLPSPQWYPVTLANFPPSPADPRLARVTRMALKK